MDLTPDGLRRCLVLVDADGWDSRMGRELMEGLRSAIVEPIVRRSGLTGPAADQAIASGWATAWEAVRRPSVRTAENPAGMVWVAVRRTVWAEAVPSPELPESELAMAIASGRAADQPLDAAGASLGPCLAPIVEALVDLGWERDLLVAAIEELADHCAPDISGVPRVRWRWVALRLGLPEWRARRLAAALLGVPGHPGVLAMVANSGPGVVEDVGVRRVLQATCRQGLASPRAHLSSWSAQQPVPRSAGAGGVPGPSGEAGDSCLKIA